MSARLADALPAMLSEDPFTREFCAGLDEVLAPVLLTLDCWPAYLDPATAPPEMLDWLALWLGLDAGVDGDVARSRARVAGASALHSQRGTRRGIELAVQGAFDVACEVSDTGGVAVAAVPGGELPESAEVMVHVVVTAPDVADVDVERLEAVVAAAVPAHVDFRIEVAA